MVAATARRCTSSGESTCGTASMAALIRSTAPRVATGLAGKSNPPGPAAAIRFSARGQSGTDAVLVCVSDPTADPELGLARPSLGYQTPSIARDLRAAPLHRERLGPRWRASRCEGPGAPADGQSASPRHPLAHVSRKPPRPVRGCSARTFRSPWPPGEGVPTPPSARTVVGSAGMTSGRSPYSVALRKKRKQRKKGGVHLGVSLEELGQVGNGPCRAVEPSTGRHQQGNQVGDALFRSTAEKAKDVGPDGRRARQ